MRFDREKFEGKEKKFFNFKELKNLKTMSKAKDEI